ncbi:hypothetical protein Tco_0151266 [Tanacetum coccineum]
MKKRITPDAITKGSWGFEHTKAVFQNKIIPFLKTLKDIFNVFDKDLLDEIMEVKMVFNQMEAAVAQCSVDKKWYGIKQKELFLENDCLLEHIICQDVVNIVMHADVTSDNVLPVQNTFLNDNIALDVLKMENDRLMELLVSQDLVHIAVNSLADIVDYKNLELVSLKLKNNREAQVDYVKITKANDDTLRDIVEQARTSNPLDNSLAYACMYRKQIQELNSMSKSVSSTCKKCLFDANHDLGVVKYLSDVNARARAKSIKSTKKKEWKSTRKIFTSTKVVPPRKPVKSTAIKNIKPSSASQWRPKETIIACSSSEPRIDKARTTNHLEPNKNWGSNVFISPCSSSVQCRIRIKCDQKLIDFSNGHMASEQSSSGPALHEMNSKQHSLGLELHQLTPGYISSRLVQNLISPTSYVPPSKKDYEILFQPLFDEYFNSPTRVVSLDSVVIAAPRAVDPGGSPWSTTIDQDVPSANSVVIAAPRVVDLAGSPSSTTTDQDVPSANPSSKETTLQGVISSNLHHLNQSFDALTKLTNNHPLENVIGDPSQPVSTRSQLQEHAIWCYFDANDNPIPFGGKRSG